MEQNIKDFKIDDLSIVGNLITLTRVDWEELSKIPGINSECLKDIRIALNNLGYSKRDEIIEEKAESGLKKSLKFVPKKDNQE